MAIPEQKSKKRNFTTYNTPRPISPGVEPTEMDAVNLPTEPEEIPEIGERPFLVYDEETEKFKWVKLGAPA